MAEIWVGADPGGHKSFGIATVGENGRFECATLSSAAEAVDFLREAPHGAGVDAPMWWSSGRSSDRLADQWLRKTFGLSSGAVQPANCLRGAALVQGALFAELLRKRFGQVPITESHPKALWKALRIAGDDDLLGRFGVTGSYANEHERDALIGAICAREGFSGRWSRNLADARHPEEQNPETYWLAPIHYFWPD